MVVTNRNVYKSDMIVMGPKSIINFKLKMAKKNLPVRIIREIKRLDEITLPEIYKAPTDSTEIDKARLEYFHREDVGGSYSAIMESYRHSATKGAEQSNQNDHESNPQSTQITHVKSGSLELALKRDAMVEHRKQTGLDKLREMLVNTIVNCSSFQEGLYHLIDHIRERKKVALRHESLPEIYIDSEDANHDEKALVSTRYPDLTADEITWMSLLKPRKKRMIYDERGHFFYPPALIGMDIDGLVFSDCSVDERDIDRIDSLSAHKIGGITCIDYESEHHQFVHNISEAVKAITVLSIDDKDLFDKLKDEEDIMPFLRGDGMLLKSSLQSRAEDFGIKQRDHRSLDELIKDSDNAFSSKDVQDLRGNVVEYLQECEFRNIKEETQGITDIIKVLGMLSRLPKFVEEGKPFKGYMMFYANNMEFIRDDGRIADSVPVTDYLKHRIAGHFHDRTISRDKRDEIVNELFTTLHNRVQEINIQEENVMPIDNLQERILTEFGILLPVQAYSKLKQIKTFSEMFMRKNTGGAYIERTLKFGFDEAEKIYNLLKSLPKAFSTNVRALSKRVQEYFDLDVFMTGDMTGGRYHPEGQRVEINVPRQTPSEASPLEFFVERELAKSKTKKRKVTERFLEAQRHDNYLAHVFLHEIGESVAANLSPDLWNHWLQLSPDASSLPLKDRDEHFLTNYATKDAKEDFCETFALYVLFGQECREKAEASPTLKDKYEFMRGLFSHDGKLREYPNHYDHSMYVVSGHPTQEREKIQQARILKSLREEELDTLEERVLFGDEALSYQDVEDIIREHETKGTPITQEEATRILRDERASGYEEKEELLQRGRVFDMVYRTTLEELFRAGVTLGDANHMFPDLSRSMLDETKEDSIKYLAERGIKTPAAKQIINKLHPLISTFEDAIRDRITYEEKSEAKRREDVEILMALGMDAMKNKDN